MAEHAQLDALVRMAALAKAAGAKDMEHMDARAGAFNSVRIAELITSHVSGRGPILDWGCGYGQISWLLRLRGVDVVPYEVAKRPTRDSIPMLNPIDIEYGIIRSRYRTRMAISEPSSRLAF
jgi:hypothetical protein